MTSHQIRLLAAAAIMTIAALSTAALKPVRVDAPAPDLDAMMPDAFAGWRRIALSQAVLPAESRLSPGEAVAYRAYRDELGRVATLVAAYGPPLGDSVRLHRPEKCYAAQGFEIANRDESAIDVDGRSVTVVDLDAKSASRREAVTYWLRAGAGFTGRDSDSMFLRLREGVARPLDGALVRVSTINGEQPQFDLNRKFLEDFSQALSPEAKELLLGRGERE